MSDSDDRPTRSTARDLARGASPQMVKTIGLLLAAFLIGIVLLNVVDDGSQQSDGVDSTTTTKGSAKTTTTTSDGGPTTTKALVQPGQIRLIVLNASGVNGVAGNTSDALKTKGYSSQEDADTASVTRKGSAVQCRAGLDREAAAIAKTLKSSSTTYAVEKFPEALPKLKDGTSVPSAVQCIVIIGTA